MTKKQKLELTWIGKENRTKLEPRILLAAPDKSYHAKGRLNWDCRSQLQGVEIGIHSLLGN